jgi:transposase-like protein
VSRYGDQFKATAVTLSSLPGVLIQDVAAALDIHPFMLSLWRKQVRDGVIVAKGAKLYVGRQDRAPHALNPNNPSRRPSADSRVSWRRDAEAFISGARTAREVHRQGKLPSARSR